MIVDVVKRSTGSLQLRTPSTALNSVPSVILLTCPTFCSGLKSSKRNSDNKQKQMNNKHAFWSQQPVPQSNSEVHDTQSIEIIQKDTSHRTNQPTSLPNGFSWITIDFTNEQQAQRVYDLLEGNYVEDSGSAFRFAYPVEFLRWALLTPDYRCEWHLGLLDADDKLIGFISGIPQTLTIHESEYKMANVNFLCVDRRLRSKGFAPLLIQELKRRCAVYGDYYVAVFTSGTLLPTPITRAQYFIRDINPRFLVEIEYSQIPRQTLLNCDKNYELALSMYEADMTLPAHTTKQFVPFDPTRHRDGLASLLAIYLQQFKLYPKYNNDEIDHWFTSRQDINYTFVAESEEGVVTDVVSFFIIPTSIIDSDDEKMLTAYNFFTCSRETIPFTNLEIQHEKVQLIQNALILAREQSADSYQILNIQDNIFPAMLRELKFVAGFGYLNYYLFGLKCPKPNTSDIGLVML